MIGYFNDETNLPHKLLLIDRPFLRLRKAFANNSSVNIRFLFRFKSKIQLSKIVQSGGSLGRPIGRPFFDHY